MQTHAQKKEKKKGPNRQRQQHAGPSTPSHTGKKKAVTSDTKRMAGRDDRGDRRALGGNHQEQRSARDGFLPNRELLMTPALTIDAPPYDVCGAATPTPPQPPPLLRRSDTKDAASVAAKPHSRRGHYRHDESLQEGARSVAGGESRGGGGHAPTARGGGNEAASANRARPHGGRRGGGGDARQTRATPRASRPPQRSSGIVHVSATLEQFLDDIEGL